MKLRQWMAGVVAVAGFWAALPVLADGYDDARAVFEGAGESARFFDSAYGYALFPTIG